MKQISIILVISLLLMSCADDKVFQVKDNCNREVTLNVEPYGIFNTEDKISGIEYQTSVGNVIWSIILIETIIVPVVLIGWYLKEPVGIDNGEVIIDNGIVTYNKQSTNLLMCTLAKDTNTSFPNRYFTLSSNSKTKV